MELLKTKNELIKYYSGNNLTFSVPVDYFGSLILSPNGDYHKRYNPLYEIILKKSVYIVDKNGFDSIVKQIEDKVNIVLSNFGIQNKYEFIDYIDELVVKENKYEIYLKFKPCSEQAISS